MSDNMTIEDVIADVENPQFNIEVEVSTRFDPRDSRSRTPILAKEWDEYYRPPRIYIFPKGESILDNLFVGRHNRPYKMYREKILPTVFEELRWDAKTKVRWSQYAGCTCPCSPGFVVTKPTLKDPHDLDEWLARENHGPPRPMHMGLENDYEPYDVHVTISHKEV